WNLDRLDNQVETYLRERTQVEINFEVDDALAKLVRLGLAQSDLGGKIRALPIAEALATLDRRWDDTFRFDGALEDH
ncbi:MAG: hypothetical protein AB7I30_15205, partial [Isosphaeraceae bacterium]